MKTMTSVERYYRAAFLVERLQQCQEELLGIEFTLGGNARVGQHLFNRIERANQGLTQAIQELKSVPALSDLATTLSLSIETVRERRRCAEIGSSPETETAHASNVSRFSRPITERNHFGE